MIELIDSSGATARRRHEQLQLTLTVVEQLERDLQQNIELLRNNRDRVASFDNLSADELMLNNAHDELMVMMLFCVT